jgi:hypothetical protein
MKIAVKVEIMLEYNLLTETMSYVFYMKNRIFKKIY